MAGFVQLHEIALKKHSRVAFVIGFFGEREKMQVVRVQAAGA